MDNYNESVPHTAKGPAIKISFKEGGRAHACQAGQPQFRIQSPVQYTELDLHAVILIKAHLKTYLTHIFLKSSFCYVMVLPINP